jgi:hypothetical protein
MTKLDVCILKHSQFVLFERSWQASVAFCDYASGSVPQELCFSSLSGLRYFSVFHVIQTGPEVLPPSYPVGTVGKATRV